MTSKLHGGDVCAQSEATHFFFKLGPKAEDATPKVARKAWCGMTRHYARNPRGDALNAILVKKGMDSIPEGHDDPTPTHTSAHPHLQDRCSTWAEQKQCVDNAVFMLDICRQACGACPSPDERHRYDAGLAPVRDLLGERLEHLEQELSGVTRSTIGVSPGLLLTHTGGQGAVEAHEAAEDMPSPPPVVIPHTDEQVAEGADGVTPPPVVIPHTDEQAAAGADGVTPPPAVIPHTDEQAAAGADGVMSSPVVIPHTDEQAAAGADGVPPQPPRPISIGAASHSQPASVDAADAAAAKTPPVSGELRRTLVERCYKMDISVDEVGRGDTGRRRACRTRCAPHARC
eukprot:366068-Chlamydomonas_euryale.AAC.9